MKFEQIPNSVTKKETINLYPERAFLRVDEEIDKIKKIESGEIEKIELSDIERENILSFENGLGERLEGIEDIKVSSNTFYLDYFVAAEGRAEFMALMGLDIIGDTTSEIKDFFLKNRQLFSNVDKKKLKELSNKSRAYSDDSLFKKISQTINENGDIDINEISNQERLNLISNPQDALEKVQKLRQFKKELKEQVELSGSDNEVLAMEKIRDLYRKKINVMIAGQANSGIWAMELEKVLEESLLSDSEKELAKTAPNLIEPGEIFSRYDRFINGVDKEYDDNGIRKQVGQELFEYAQEVNVEFVNNDLKKESLIKEKGLNPKKINKKNITAEEFSKWSEELLDFYNKKTENSPEIKKWKFVAKEETKSMSVVSKQKIIKSGTKAKSISDTLGTLLGHEFTHLVQAENREKIPLRLFGEKMGGFRSEVFSEGGAMLVENDVCKEFFGYEKNPAPHYIKAMAKKLDGGNYLDCVKTYYESSIEGVLIKKKNNQLTHEEFLEALNDNLELAINRSKRLFKDGDDLNNNSSYLTHSKDTVYAEQVLVMNKLRENGLENCAFVKGVDLNTLATLMEIGLVDLNKIERPNIDIVRKIWNQEKPKYELD